ncbi:DUF6144 family protein [Saccharicrinis sp. FJH54]|uniref:DUF6144 family protein n=1 Tax=Saccharicrinis sp. FJH54 TaxID=3344665 RepID=UPI0035D4B4C5
MDRKSFVKSTCFAGACFCGFSTISAFTDNSASENQDKDKPLYQQWLSNLLSDLNRDIDEETLRKIVKKSAEAHYISLNMDALLADYVGDLDKFNAYIESAWGWKIDYDKTTKVLIADENKTYCVCPVLEHNKEVNTSAICYCSEGFAEKMFSVVTGAAVHAKVISSVRKGDKTCKYKIEIA